MCGGGPSSQQKQATQGSLDLSNTMSEIFKQNQAQVNPFYSNLMKFGIPGINAAGDYGQQQVASSFAPARAQLATGLARMGGLPSGFATQANTDLDASQARASDQQMLQNILLNQQAKQQGAQGLNPLAFGSQAQQGYGSIMQMPVQPSPLGGILGGALGGLSGLASGLAMT